MSDTQPELAATFVDSGTGRQSAPPGILLERGAKIGRYLVVDTLGVGGMGAVYSAYDPELDRKVAIKVLRGTDDGSQASDGRARMLREAQAIARLQHPNVIAVHDVGPCFANQVFIAMELVDGATLSAWLKAAARTPAEILAMFLQAARGLAAAHAAGLVHRDFKPDNVLVGKDGRARVADFGLVRQDGHAAGRATTAPIEQPVTSSPLSAELTHAGSIMGTPHYMAPEQRTGDAADARADQFSFCLSLDEALAGATRLSPHVRAALRRGQQVLPDERWPSMRELIGELERDPSAQRRRVWMIVGGLAVAGGIAVGAALLARATTATDPCSGGGERLADAWNAEKRGAIERAFAATKAPYAASATAGVVAALDSYTAAWAHSYEESCRATHVRHEQSADMLDLRTGCLAQRHAELAAFVDVLAGADRALVARAVTAAQGLPDVRECDHIGTLEQLVPLPADPGKRQTIADLREQHAKAYAQWLAGHPSEARRLAEPLYARAKEVGYRPFEGQVGLLVGQIQQRTGHAAEALATLRAAFVAALAGHADEGAAKIALTLEQAFLNALDQAHAEEWAVIADGLIERLGNPPEVRAAAENVRGYAASTAGRHGDAIARYRQALAIREKLDHQDIDYGVTLSALAHELDEVGQYAEARAMGERALAVELPKLGADHPEIAIVLNNLGNVAADEGDLDAARGYYERVRAIREKGVAAGDRPDKLADVTHNLGDLAFTQARYDDALALFTRAVALREQVDPSDPEITLPITGVANVHMRKKEFTEALAGYQRARDLAERRLGPSHPYVGDALVGIGDCQRELGDLSASRLALERALAIRQTDARPVELAEAQFELAQTLAKAGDPTRARALAQAARDTYAAQKGADHEREEVDTWLASLRR